MNAEYIIRRKGKNYQYRTCDQYYNPCYPLNPWQNDRESAQKFSAYNPDLLQKLGELQLNNPSFEVSLIAVNVSPPTPTLKDRVLCELRGRTLTRHEADEIIAAVRSQTPPLDVILRIHTGHGGDFPVLLELQYDRNGALGFGRQSSHDTFIIAKFRSHLDAMKLASALKETYQNHVIEIMDDARGGHAQ